MNITPSVPVMTVERFSELTGMSHDTVYMQAKRGYLPTIKSGRRLLINVAMLTRQCLESDEVLS